jgi:hypothetical protein
MLAVNTYANEYIKECRSRMEQQLAAYRALVSSMEANEAAARAAVESFEPLFFRNLLLVLDHYFVHRTRAIEGKDGNPLNELRMLCSSILHNDGVLTADKTIKYNAETSVLKLRVGDEIRIHEVQFVKLFKACFAEIRSRFA